MSVLLRVSLICKEREQDVDQKQRMWKAEFSYMDHMGRAIQVGNWSNIDVEQVEIRSEASGHQGRSN